MLKVKDACKSGHSDEDDRGAEKDDHRVVLMVIDDSEHSKNVFRWFLDNMWKSGDLLVLSYCLAFPDSTRISCKIIDRSGEIYNKILADIEEKIKTTEVYYIDLCRKNKIPFRVKSHREEFRAKAVCRVAEDEAVDMIVLRKKKKRNKLKRIFCHDSCLYIVKNCNVPCTFVPKHLIS